MGAQNWLVPDTGYKDIYYPWGMTADSVNNCLFTCGAIQTVLHNNKWESWYPGFFDSDFGIIPYKNGRNLYCRWYYENNDPAKLRTAVMMFSNATDMDTVMKLVGNWYITPFTRYNGKDICSIIPNGGQTVSYNCIAEFTGTGFIPMGRPSWNNMYNSTGQPVNYKNQLYTAGVFDSAFAVMKSLYNWEVVSPGITGSNRSIAGLLTYNDRIYIYGGFWKFQNPNNPGNSIAAWDGIKWDSLQGGASNEYVPLNAGFDDGVVCGGKLFLCGDFTHVGGMRASRIVSWNDTTWCTLAGDIDSLSGRVYRLECLQDTLYALGDFSNVNGYNLNSSIAKLANIHYVDSCHNVSKKSYIPEESFDFKYYPNVCKDMLTIKFMSSKYNFSTLNVMNSLGQIMYVGENVTTTIELDLGFLASGIYYIQLRGASKQKTFKVIKE